MKLFKSKIEKRKERQEKEREISRRMADVVCSPQGLKEIMTTVGHGVQFQPKRKSRLKYKRGLKHQRRYI